MFGKTTFRLKKVLKIINYISSYVDEAMKTTFNFLFFCEKILHAQKAQKAYKRTSDFLPLRCFLNA